MGWVGLALTAQALWGVVDILDKITRERILRDSLALAVFLGIAALPSSFAIAAFRGYDFAGIPTLLVLAAGFISPLAFLFYFRALAIEEASRVVPLFQMNPIWALVLSTIFLGERLDPGSYVAFALIFSGGAVVSLHSTGGKGLRLSGAFWLMLVCTFIYGSAQVLAKAGYEGQEPWDVAKWATLGYGLGGLSFLLAPQVRRRMREGVKTVRWWGWAIIGVDQLALSSAARILNLLALATGPVALVTVMSAFQSGFVLLYALVSSVFWPDLLKEEVTRGTVSMKILALILLATGLLVLNREALLGQFLALTQG